MQGYSSPADLRTAELASAGRVLNLADIRYLGYRDSGMPGTTDNKYPQALMAAPVDEVVERMVKVIRDLKPDVIITHDPGGGYGHPDHIATHNAAIKAFHAAGDFTQFLEDGPAFQPGKLYFPVRSRRILKIMIRLMPLWGQNPHRFGRNKDIDLTLMAKVDYPVNAAIFITEKDAETQRIAAACHASQGGGQSPQKGLFRFMNALYAVHNFLFGQRAFFTRVYPPVIRKHRESDLFEGIQ